MYFSGNLSESGSRYAKALFFWLGSYPRNPHLTRIFRDVCALKSSRSPPYAATRNFCTLRIFYRTACSIFGTPKFSTCGMSLICGAPKFSIWDMKNFKARPIELFGHLWCSETVSGPYFSRWNWTFTSPVEIEILNDQPTDKRSFLGGNQKRLRFFTPQRGRIGSFGSNIFKLARPASQPPANLETSTPPKSSIFQ